MNEEPQMNADERGSTRAGFAADIVFDGIELGNYTAMIDGLAASREPGMLIGAAGQSIR